MKEEICMLEEKLRAYIPFEEVCRIYFSEHGTFMPEKEIPKKMISVDFSVPHADIRNIAECDNQRFYRYLQYSSTKSLGEDIFFLPEYDIFIQKHARFFKSEMHSHTYFELCYQYEGTCRQEIIGETQKEVLNMKQGDLLLLPPGQKHIISALSDGIVLNIGVRSSTFAQSFFYAIPEDSVLGDFFLNTIFSEHTNVSWLLFTAGEVVRQKIQEMILTYLSDERYAPRLLNLHLSSIFLLLMEEQDDRYNLRMPGGMSQKLPNILQYIEKNALNSTVADVAEHFGYSPDHLNRVFRRETGKTVKDVQLSVRMQKAAMLLKKTGMTVGDVAEYVGYRDETSFIRCFRSRYGQTPAQYRKTAKTTE